MSQPTLSDVHIDAALTNMSLMFMQKDTQFVAKRVFPIVYVDRKSDKYFTFDRNQFLRDEMKLRAPGAESAGSGYVVSTDSFNCDVFALHKDIPDQVRENTDSPLDSDRNATQYLTSQALQRLERQWVTDYFGTSIWTTDVTPTNLWSNYSLSTPIQDIRLGKRTVLASTGMEPNKLVLGYDVYRQLQDHPDIIDRIKYTSSDVVTPELLARLFEVDEVLVARAIGATNVENETAAYSFLEGKHALLAYAPPTAALENASAGYTFVWRGISRGLGADVAIKRFRIEEREVDRLEIESAWDNKKVSADLGYFFNSVVA